MIYVGEGKPCRARDEADVLNQHIYLGSRTLVVGM